MSKKKDGSKKKPTTNQTETSTPKTYLEVMSDLNWGGDALRPDKPKVEDSNRPITGHVLMIEEKKDLTESDLALLAEMFRGRFPKE